MRLQAVEPRRLYRQIADQIRGLIESGEVARGARLPAERDLARQLKVSRPSLREALIALEMEGLLDVRVGSGIYVTRPGSSAPDAASVGDPTGPFEVIRARWLIESECAALAARYAGAEQLRAIREAHQRMAEETRRNPNPLEADRLFHVRVAEASGNSALVLVVETLWDQRVGPLYRALERKVENPQMAGDTLREHQAIVAAIARRDSAAARAAMRRHMDMTKKRYSRDWKAVQA
ncbi:MAG: FadR family transcriptional regulator [Betaproteobacteria bacterium]|nr:FadR family transcriptional regulator [Betaproteobacteria bacterium]